MVCIFVITPDKNPIDIVSFSDPCPLIKLDGPTSSAILPDVIGHKYVIQEDTYNSSTPVYIRVGTPMMFLFEELGTWYLADRVSQRTDYAKIVDSADTPDKLGSSNATWQLFDNGTWIDAPDITITCTSTHCPLRICI